MKQHNEVPANYADLFTMYVEGSNSLCTKVAKGIAPYLSLDELEEIRSAVILRCMEHSVIEKFNATKANFGGVIFFVTRTVVTRLLRGKENNPVTSLRTKSIVETQREFEAGSYSLDRNFESDDRTQPALEASDTLRAVFGFAENAASKASNKRDRSLLPMLHLIESGATVDEVAASLQVTVTTVKNWMGYLRSSVVAA